MVLLVCAMYVYCNCNEAHSTQSNTHKEGCYRNILTRSALLRWGKKCIKFVNIFLHPPNLVKVTSPPLGRPLIFLFTIEAFQGPQEDRIECIVIRRTLESAASTRVLLLISKCDMA